MEGEDGWRGPMWDAGHTHTHHSWPEHSSGRGKFILSQTSGKPRERSKRLRDCDPGDTCQSSQHSGS